MPREKNQLKRRPGPLVHGSRLVPGLLGIAVVAVGFGALMVRLEVTQEGYRLSELRAERSALQDRNRQLRLEAAELSSHEQLRKAAARDGLEPPAPGQVVMIP
jgi:cell division protein FtsL